MSNRAARRREQRAGRMEKSPRAKTQVASPVINVWVQDGMFVQQVALGPGYVAEMKLPLELAENYLAECEAVVTELRTGLKVQRETSSSLIVPR